MNENTAVESKAFYIVPSTYLKFDRSIIAQDSATLSHLLSTSVHPKALIQLMNASTNAVIVTLDSFQVNSATDTITRTGTISYYNSALIGDHVYVKASITADSNVAKWDLTSEIQYETGDTLGSGFDKAILPSSGVSAPETDAVINLSAYPNPFNPTTLVSYTVPDGDQYGITQILVSDVLKRNVATLVNQQVQAGRHSIPFDGRSLPAGMYFITAQTLTHTDTKSIILVK